MGNQLSPLKPGHLNMGRALRSLEHKTGSVRRLTFELPEMYAKDSYGVETSTLKLPKINVPSLLANVQPVTTRNYQLAKEGRYITGAAKIYLPNMQSILASTVYNAVGEGNNATDVKPYEWGKIPNGDSTSQTGFTSFFRGFDGLMDGVFYDEDAEIWNSQWAINQGGTTNWDASTNYASLLGSDFTPFSSGTTLTSDNESVTISVSGQRNNTGTVLWLTGERPATFLADRVSFDVQFGSDDGNENEVPRIDGQALDFYVMVEQGGSAYNYIRYKMDMDSDFKFNAGMFLRYDYPLTSGSVGTFYNSARPINPWYNRTHAVPDDYPRGTFYAPNNITGKITMAQTPTAGSLNTSGSFTWTKAQTGGSLILGWRFKCNNTNVPTGGLTVIKIKNIRFYRSLPWSVHSIKERKDDFVVLNCVRTDGDSMHRQEAYSEQVPEL